MRDGPILIVDDDTTIRDLLLAVLNDDGYNVVAVGNGYDALCAVSVHQPAVMLLDLNLPLLDGAGVLRWLREHGSSVSVLLMTADPRGQRLGTVDGVCGHVPKPFDLDDLTLAIQTVLVAKYETHLADSNEAEA